MTYRLIIKPLAENDMKELYDWYDEQQPGLGDRFLMELEKSIDLAKDNPYQYQVRYKDVRLGS